MSKHVSVVGAGFAGLTVSLRLAQKGFTVDLYESSSRVGGLLGTEITEHGLSENAANALIKTYKAEALFEELGLISVVPLEESKKRFIFRGKPLRWPLRFSESVAAFFKFIPTFVFNKSSLNPRRQQTLQAWGETHLGHAPTQYLLGPAMQGIYASDGAALSARLILGPMFGQKKKTGAYRGLLTGKNGMQDVINALEEKIRSLGVRVHLNTVVNVADLQGPVVVATSAMTASRLIESRAPELAAALGRVHAASLLSVKLFFKKAQEKYKGFGCLIPRQYGMKTMGVLLNTYIFPHRDKTYSETWILGGPQSIDILQAPDEEILKLIAEERFKIFGNREGLLDYRIHRWINALPLYDLELEKVLEEIKQLPRNNVFLHGNYLGGIGLSKILDRSDDLAEEISKNV